MTLEREKLGREKWEAVKSLFDAAQELAPGDVTSFLQEHGSDSSIRAEVGGLLAELRRAEGFLSDPAVDSIAQEATSDQADFKSGDVISGRYTIT